MPRRPSAGSTAQGVSERFAGFAPPTSNTTYCPNQFFDVCLPHCSRGAVRLVAYLIRQTLGWCDTQGNPQAEQHAVSYADLIRAGISRDMIRSALDEAAGGHFIRCVREPEAKKAGQAGASGLYELQWDERGEYVKDPRQFRGFFAGEGNRTYVPNAFFDRVVANEKLAVVKVVGSVIRLSIGFANKWGHRRRHVSLSFQHIQNYARLRDRTTLSQAVRHALAANYLERVEAGYFDPRGGKLSRSAVYALKWLDDPEPAPTTAAEGGIGRKNLPAKNDLADRSENPTGVGRKSRPEDRSENPTGIEIKQGNNTYKQQDFAAATFEKLRSEGFDAKAARAIACDYPPERVERQIRWLDRRHVRSNRLGMLRAAIEGDWPAPGAGVSRRLELGRPNSTRLAGLSFAAALDHARRRLPAGPNPHASSTQQQP